MKNVKYDFEETIKWENNKIIFLDQTLLPVKEKYLEITTHKMLAEAIKKLRIRGAPAIGVSAAYGIALAIFNLQNKNLSKEKLIKEFQGAYTILNSTRPTAVNLSWALNKMKEKFDKIINQYNGNIKSIFIDLLTEAHKIKDEDITIGLKLAKIGNKIIKNNDVILTHCNAGGLATAGMGSALSVLYYANKFGKKIQAYADETRPLLQGARLTTYELKKWGIDVTLICDNMAAHLMRDGIITKVITGADRIASNGDAANKIGTYSVAALAKYHKIPFYIAAPYSTFDMKLKSGKEIPIEMRDKNELIYFKEKRIAPDGIKYYNPAFDVTPGSLITGIITEKGIISKPYSQNIKKLFG